MKARLIVASGLRKEEAKYAAGIEACATEIAGLRRGMKKTDAEIRRLETSTRRTLARIQSKLHVEATV